MRSGAKKLRQEKPRVRDEPSDECNERGVVVAEEEREIYRYH